jgi:hypothetical protein
VSTAAHRSIKDGPDRVTDAPPPFATGAFAARAFVKVTRADGPYPEAIGGFWVVEVPSREEALEWAAKTAVACRCPQEVREFMPDPAVGN